MNPSENPQDLERLVRDAFLEGYRCAATMPSRDVAPERLWLLSTARGQLGVDTSLDRPYNSGC